MLDAAIFESTMLAYPEATSLQEEAVENAINGRFGFSDVAESNSSGFSASIRPFSTLSVVVRPDVFCETLALGRSRTTWRSGMEFGTSTVTDVRSIGTSFPTGRYR